MFMHWENTHVLAIVEAMLIFWELTCALSVVHWITRGTREISGNVVHCQALCIIIWPLLNKRTCVTCWQGAWHTPNMAAMMVHCLTSTHQETCMVYQPSGDMLARSVTHSKHGSHGGPVWPLPIKRTGMPYQPSGDMLARSVTLSKHGSHGGALSDLYPSRGHACPINHLETWWQGAWHSPNMAAMVVHCLTSTHQEDIHALSTTWRHAGQHCWLSHVNRQLFLILDLVKMEWNFLQYNEENLIFIFFT